jgi:hypothetical protein
VEWWNGGMAEWRNGGMAEWQNGGMAEWRNGGMAEWHNVQYKIVRNQDMESTQMLPWQSPSWLVLRTKMQKTRLGKKHRTTTNYDFWIATKNTNQTGQTDTAIHC